MTSLFPNPIALTLAEFENETQPFIKLHRLIDTYEVVIKYSTVLALQNFYTANLAEEFPDLDQFIRQELSKPISLGRWIEFLREILKKFGTHESRLFSSELYRFYFKNFSPKPKTQSYFAQQKESDQLLNLRNRLAHGATLTDDDAEAVLQQYIPFLQRILKKANFLTTLPLIFVENNHSDCVFDGILLMGFGNQAGQVTVTNLSPQSLQHLVVQNPSNNTWLDLHPLLLYDKCLGVKAKWNETHTHVVGQQQCGDRKILFFNDLKKEKRLNFLDYWRGHHSQFTAPAMLDEFRERFPKVESQPQTVLSDTKEQHLNIFVQTHLEFFVGRETELARINDFVEHSTKRVLIVFGSPGIGKTALLANWSDQRQAIQHFIREGEIDSYDAARIFEYLAQKISQRYGTHWNNPGTTEISAYRNALTETASATSEPILIVLDGLDEAVRANRVKSSDNDNQTIVDWLPEPAFWPRNVHLVMSSRPDIKNSATFQAKFGQDKADWLDLEKLSDAEIRSLLYQVYSKYEVIALPDYVDAIVKRSEGSPLYLRMLVDDLVQRRLIFGQTDKLPQGLIAYFERILKSITKGNVDIQTAVQNKAETYQRLVSQEMITPEVAEQELLKEQQSLDVRGATYNLELVALYSLAREPMRLDEAANVIGATNDSINRAYEVGRTVLAEHAEGGYLTIFHASFREYFLNLKEYNAARLNPYAELILDMKQRLFAYCQQWSQHHSAYALRWLPTYLADYGKPDEIIGLLKNIDFILWKIYIHNTLALLKDFDLSPLPPVLVFLRQSLEQNRHLLDRCTNLSDLKATLLSRIAFLSELREGAYTLQSGMSSYHYTPLHPFPDIPVSNLVKTVLVNDQVSSSEWVIGCAISIDRLR